MTTINIPDHLLAYRIIEMHHSFNDSKSDELWRDLAKKINLQIPEKAKNIYFLVIEHIKKNALFKLADFNFLFSNTLQPKVKFSFFVSHNNPTTLYIGIRNLINNSWEDISIDIPLSAQEQIYRLLTSCSENIKKKQEEIKNYFNGSLLANKTIHILSSKASINTLNMLEPNGNWTIKIISDFSEKLLLEDFIDLNFYNKDEIPNQ